MTNAERTPRQWYAHVWALSWPIIVANISIPLVGVVDTAVVGRLPDATYLGGVAVGATMLSAMYWIFSFLRMGTTGLTAQAFGARQIGEAVAVAARGVVVAVGLGAILLAVSPWLRDAALNVFQASDVVEGRAAAYFSIRIWGAPFLLVHLVTIGVLFGLQRMRETLVVTIAFNVLNVCLDVWFVLGLGMGVAGIALGSVLAELLAAMLGVLFVIRAFRMLGWGGGMPPSLLVSERLFDLFHISVNLMIRTLLVQLPFLTFTVLAARLGDVALAANAVLMQFFHILSFGLDGFAHATESLVGHAFGAGDKKALVRAVRYSTILCACLALAMSLTFAATLPVLVGWMTDLPRVHAAALDHGVWVVCMPMVAVWAFQMDGVYIGTTQIRALRNNMLVATAVYFVALLVTPDKLGSHAIWLALTAFMAARGLTLWRGYPGIVAKLGSVPVDAR